MRTLAATLALLVAGVWLSGCGVLGLRTALGRTGTPGSLVAVGCATGSRGPVGPCRGTFTPDDAELPKTAAESVVAVPTFRAVRVVCDGASCRPTGGHAVAGASGLTLLGLAALLGAAAVRLRGRGRAAVGLGSAAAVLGTVGLILLLGAGPALRSGG